MQDNHQLSIIVEEDSMGCKNYKYEVVLSFAGEQRHYVEQVSKRLKELGISHFYDKDLEAELWGKNLAQHFQTVYFEQSRFFVPFISREYKTKIWTRLEFSFALDRNMQQRSQDYQNYILPVYLEKTSVPGLVGSIGYIDGSTVTPTELAELIYEKVTGNPPAAHRDTHNNTIPEAEEDSFQTPHTTFLRKLNESYSGMDNSCCIVVSGERGVGKRTMIHQFLLGKANVLHVKPEEFSRYALEPIAYALDYSDYLLSENNDLRIPDRIMRKLVEFCNAGQKPIVFFENVEMYPSGLSGFVLKFCQYLFNHRQQFQMNPVYVILEYDNNNGNDVGELVYQLPAQMVRFFQIPRIMAEQLKECAEKMLGELRGDSCSINYIFRASCGNLLYLNIIINYLRMKGFLSKQGDMTSICKEIPEGALADVLRKYIFQRYDRLDPELKEILSKSAVIGQRFEQEILENPFDVQDADKMLQKIEELTRLIKEERLGVYSFETIDSYRLITSAISREELQKWHSILAEFYQRKLDGLYSTRCNPEKNELLSLYILVAKHNQYAGQHSAAISTYLRLIEFRISIADYDGAIANIMITRELCARCAARDILLLLDQFEARCYFEVGDYKKALTLYSQSSSMDDKTDNWADRQLEQAYCYYMLGENRIALQQAIEIKLRLEGHNLNNCLAYYKTLSFLASINDALNNAGEKRRLYIQALNYCRKNNYEKEYYVAIKKASMVFDEQLSIPMYLDAAAFFRRTQQIKELSETLHNMATDLVYLDRATEAAEPLSECIQLFDSFGSKMVHYPLNTKGIIEALGESDYRKAIATFKQALVFITEPFSEITIRTNIAQCLLKLRDYSTAKTEIESVDSIINQIGTNAVPVYQTYHALNWGFYFYCIGNYQNAITYFQKCKNIKHLEPRFNYIFKQMLYLSRKHQKIKSIVPTTSPPKPILKKYIDRELYFTTVRFFE